MTPTADVLLSKILTKKTKFKECPDVLKSFAATLHFYSPKAYDYVRSHLLLCLPSPSTIRKWYNKIDGSPGISTLALQAIKRRVDEEKRKGNRVICGLQIDDIAIRQGIAWDGKKFVGYIDYGIQMDDEELREAKNATVLMCVAVNSNWKIPVSYYLIDSFNGKKRAEIINHNLLELNDTGIEIISLTFDGTATNFAMANALGASISHLQGMKTYFSNPYNGKPIFIILDACHMIKLVRNCLASQGSIYYEGHSINWSYFELLVEYQNQHGLHLGTEIRSRHLNWFKEKMKVSLAVQCFSSSVASAFKYLRERLNLDKFKNSFATEQFCSTFDEIFDLLNSRNKYCKNPQKGPITINNIKEIKEKVKKYVNYICSIELIQGKSILDSKLKTGFLGFIITMKSIIEIYDIWVSDQRDDFSYLLTYKFSQDHLELFFSAVRNRSGNNNNPTTVQFISAMKKLLVHADVNASQYANCIAQDATTLLHCKKSIQEENDVSAQQSDYVHKLTTISAEHDYALNAAFTNINQSYIEDTVAYIAGFVAKKIGNRISCKVCISQLSSDTSLSQLQDIKCRGKLFKASPDVIKICRVAESCFRNNLDIVEKNNNNLILFLTLKALPNIPSWVFCNFIHNFDQEVLSDHRYEMLQIILQTYFNLRLHHHAKTKSEVIKRIRHHLTKTVLFSHQ